MRFVITFDEEGHVKFRHRVICGKPNLLELDEALKIDRESEIFFYTEKKLKQVFFPIDYKEEIYWAKNGSELLISNSFFVLCKMVRVDARSDSVSNEQFIGKGSCDTGSTLTKRVFRLIPNQLLAFNNGTLGIKSNNKITSNDDTVSFDSFKLTLDSVIASYAKKNNFVLFSGGADSVLLALILKKLGYSTELLTFKPEPLNKIAAHDLARASIVAEHCEFKHKIISLNIEDYSLSTLHPYIDVMPSSSHLCIPFDVLFQSIQKEKESMVFCGQNADNLYNFGFTSPLSISRQGLIDIVGRFLLSNFYLRQVSSQHKLYPAKLLTRTLGGGLAAAYSFEKKQRYRQPKHLGELLEGVKCSAEGLIFVPKDYRCTSEPLSAEVLIKQLVDFKIGNYTRSGASSVVYAASCIHQIPCALPYSSDRLLPFYYQIKRDFKNIVYPKHFIYKYIKELCPGYAKLVKLVAKASIDKYPSYSVWCQKLLLNTIFGEALMENIDKRKQDFYLDEKRYPTTSQQLNAYLNAYWYRSAMNHIRESTGI